MYEGNASGAFAESDEWFGLFIANSAALFFDFWVISDDFVGETG